MASPEVEVDALATVRAPTRMLREFLTVSQAFEGHFGRTLEVHPTDLAAMELLIEEGPMAPRELAARLGITRSATTSVVDRLEAAGHVHRSVDDVDRRRVIVTPSEASTARAMATLLPLILEIDRMLDDYSAEEQAVIADYLTRMLTVYRRHAMGEITA